jgi:ribosome-binding factor A
MLSNVLVSNIQDLAQAIMRSRRFSRKPMSPLADRAGPEDGVDPRTVRPESSRRVFNRKALQLCAQVAETLSLVLQGECDDDVLRDLMVLAVVPAPDSTQLLVTLGPAPGANDWNAGQIMEHVHKAHGKLRSEVAAAIHRRKTPALLFTFVEKESAQK